MSKEQLWKTFRKLCSTLCFYRRGLQFLEGKPESIAAVCSSTGVGVDVGGGGSRWKSKREAKQS